MPRSFTEEETTRLRERLLTEGRRLFERFGLSRTTVEDLARVAGISKGSFYRFFPSKEQLFMEILEQEEASQKTAVLRLAHDQPSARRALYAVLEHMFAYARSDSLIVRLRQSGDFALLARVVGNEHLARHFDEDERMIDDLFDILRSKGADCNVDTRVFAGLLRGIAMITMHEEEVGIPVIDSALSLLLSYVADGLLGTTEAGSENE